MFPAVIERADQYRRLIAAPPTVFDGCTVKTSWVAVPGVMSNAVLAHGGEPGGARPERVARAVLLTLKPKVAMPLTPLGRGAAEGRPPGLFPIAMRRRR